MCIPYHPAVWRCSCIPAQDSWCCHSWIGSTSSQRIAVLRLKDQNNKTQHQRASECHNDRVPRSPKRPAATDSAAEACTIVVPLSSRAVGPVQKSRIRGCPHPDPEAAQPWLCVYVVESEDYLSPLTAATWASGRVPMKTDVKVNQRECVAFSVSSNIQYRFPPRRSLSWHKGSQVQKIFKLMKHPLIFKTKCGNMF